GLLEIAEDALLVFGQKADAGIANDKANMTLGHVRLGDQRDAALLRELDGVTGEVEQHLAQARLFADHLPRPGLVDERADIDAFGLRARRQKLDDAFNERGERERTSVELHLAGLNLGKIENLLDQRQQRFTGCLRRLGVSGLFGRERSVEQQ